MKNGIKAKLKSQAGETIGETLIALLISVLALTMLAGAISTAANLITRSEKVMAKYYDGINDLGNPNIPDKLAVVVKDKLNNSIKLVGECDSIDVDYAVNEAFGSKPIIAYKQNAG